MSRDPQKRIAEILDAIEKCERYHLPPEATGAHPEIAWPQIRGAFEPPGDG